MTSEEVQSAVRHIEAISGDDESAHSARDALWHQVLVQIAEGHPQARALALEAVKTEEIRFERWCA